ncbi:hypothetical protein SAMN05444170_0165 [Bradyrhizobium erythrophlei]|uniref:Uncharacterized protein n=1 Tax=Bradyrhizobium erythrophlei TaxID=1437360 RepID=A0A1M7SSZ4_9BRAD|nr:hypothetical protein SAMN05444170_0165 [Bradyrhizobium erythrophlei]
MKTQLPVRLRRNFIWKASKQTGERSPARPLESGRYITAYQAKSLVRHKGQRPWTFYFMGSVVDQSTVLAFFS